jgi:transposase
MTIEARGRRCGCRIDCRPSAHAEAHEFCLAHLIRDAQYAIDHSDTIFAPQFKAFLKDACTVGRRRPDLADSTITTHRRRLDRELDRLLDLKPIDVQGSHLRATSR